MPQQAPLARSGPPGATMACVSWLRGAYPVRVQGESMRPLLRPGARIMVATVRADDRLQPGAVVVARRPDRPAVVMVKRIIGVTPDGDLLLAGDNPAASTESVDFGPVKRTAVLGRARLRYWPLPPRLL